MSFFEELTPDNAGRSPYRNGTDGEAQGPYAFASANRDQHGNARGYSTGVGLAHGQSGGASYDIMSANANFGGWRDAGGETNVGFGADAQVAKFGIAPGGPLGNFGFDVGALDASANASFNSSTAGIGAQANLIEGSVSHGTSDRNSADDRFIRLGGSVGVGAAGRVHYGDADGDGRREYGFGFDAGPLSFDYKTENPIGDLLTMPMMGTNALMSGIGLGRYAPGSMVQRGVEGAWDWATHGGPGRALSAVGRGIGNAAQSVGNGLSTVGRGIGNVASTVGNGIVNGASAVGRGISNAASTVGTGIANGASAVGRGISSAASTVGTGISNAAGAVGRGARAAWNAVTGW
ncbi:MAG: hypothetical protein JNM40_01375 [Myxococcales bacterium]|nr:hypothetical protein [Myxococcales bacterium]